MATSAFIVLFSAVQTFAITYIKTLTYTWTREQPTIEDGSAEVCRTWAHRATHVDVAQGLIQRGVLFCTPMQRAVFTCMGILWRQAVKMTDGCMDPQVYICTDHWTAQNAVKVITALCMEQCAHVNEAKNGTLEHSIYRWDWSSVCKTASLHKNISKCNI